ncbi:PaaI family thioesterase [Ideonella sp. A 288]|uniref:PaaI family thioesterase n=1 Tax=Ideonella sp. A 288 TaxID=1962181 RepID=UPI000B4ABC06|nr:PaaI family thioesterase [Ideonella sp. A 288]
MTHRPKSGPDRHVPFIDHLGIAIEHAQGGTSRVAIDLRPELLNNHAGGHGCVVMTLLDCAMAHAALSRIDYAREVVTVDLHVAFMRPPGGRLVATGRATGGGRSVCFCEARITDERGELAAPAMGTFRYRDPA